MHQNVTGEDGVLAAASRKTRTLLSHVERYGPGAGVRLLLGEPLAAVGALRIGVCNALPDALRVFRSLPPVPGVEVRRLGAEEVLRRSAQAEDWFFPGAVEESLARGDECFGAYVDGVLACSKWCATRPLLVLGAIVGFGPDCVWEHRIFTKPQYRGRGYGAALGLPAAEFFAARGLTTFLHTIEWTNHASRRLNERVGYRRVATLVRIGGERFGRTLLLGGGEFGIRLVGRGP